MKIKVGDVFQGAYLSNDHRRLVVTEVQGPYNIRLVDEWSGRKTTKKAETLLCLAWIHIRREPTKGGRFIRRNIPVV